MFLNVYKEVLTENKKIINKLRTTKNAVSANL